MTLSLTHPVLHLKHSPISQTSSITHLLGTLVTIVNRPRLSSGIAPSTNNNLLNNLLLSNFPNNLPSYNPSTNL